ncbi:MAG: SOS response-associated peptidase [Caulobacteraceae bacterium]|nr:SOS response-associated peptidase [Caulobacteraceae bacterium]
MCNEYQLILPFDDIIEAFNRTGSRLVFPGGMPNFGPMASIRIGDRAPIVTTGSAGPEVHMTPWAWKGPGGRPVFNFRSDGRSFAGATRCAIPADGFFEFTAPEPGQKRKTKWRFALAGQPSFWIAGLVREGAFAMLTTEPGTDIQPYHDRQIVLLGHDRARDWLQASRPEADLIRPSPPGALTVEKVFP